MDPEIELLFRVHTMTCSRVVEPAKQAFPPLNPLAVVKVIRKASQSQKQPRNLAQQSPFFILTLENCLVSLQKSLRVSGSLM